MSFILAQVIQEHSLVLHFCESFIRMEFSIFIPVSSIFINVFIRYMNVDDFIILLFVIDI